MFTIPNEDDATYEAQARVSSVDLQALATGFSRTGVVSGMAVSVSTGRDFDISSGAYEINGSPISSVAKTGTIGAGDATHPRIDIVSVDGDGSVRIAAGTPAADPVAPNVVLDRVVLASIYVPAGMATLLPDMISDRRVLLTSAGLNAYDAAGTAAAAQAAAIAAAATDATTKADAKVADAINDGVTTVAPSQNAVFDALATKADLASPALTGNPTAPTQTVGDNSTRIATTAFVAAAAGGGGSAPITSPKVPVGRYLSPPINFMWSTPYGAYVWWVPVTVECPQAFNAIGLIVQSAGAGVTADFALVEDAGGYPGTVLQSSTDVPLTTAIDAVKVGAFSAISLPVGLVWMAVRIADPHNNCQVVSAANTGQQPWGIPYTHFQNLPPYPNGGAHTSYGGGYMSGTVLSSIPTTAPSGMVGLARNSPLPGLRAASW